MKRAINVYMSAKYIVDQVVVQFCCLGTHPRGDTAELGGSLQGPRRTLLTLCGYLSAPFSEGPAMYSWEQIWACTQKIMATCAFKITK